MNMPGFEIFLIFVLIILNGIFSAGEIAIVSSRKSRIKELAKDGASKRVEKLLEMKENPERFLSAVQVGITLFGTLASAIGGIVGVKYLVPLLGKIPFLRPAVAESLSVGAVVAVLTYLFLVIGELVPKYVGMNYKERVALTLVPVFEFTSRVLFFAVSFLSFSTMFVVHGLNLKQKEEHVGEGEIKILLQEGRRKGVFDRTEEELIHGVFDFAHLTAKEIMVSKPNVYAIDVDEGKDSILRYVVESEYSRYPVYREHLDNIIGVVYQKDITRSIWNREPFDLEKILKKPYFVPDTIEISILLKEMQRKRLHMAVVIDEYGTTVGIVTLEDIIEEIFGEIMDETDVDDRVERLRDGSIVIDASYPIRDINQSLDLHLDESPDYETVGGFILDQLQGIPRGGEIIYYGASKFTVVDVEGQRIRKVKIEKARPVIKKKQRGPVAEEKA
jgi:putative hemolysin